MSASVTHLSVWMDGKGLGAVEQSNAQRLSERKAAKLARGDHKHQRKRKAAVRAATPRWANLTLIQAMYAKAQIRTRKTGIQHVVDHIIPIQGCYVCGLHTHQNLQVITARMNSKKHNRWWDE